MAKLKSMAITAAERKEKGYDKPCTIGGDRYSYGLRINLENEDLEKLDLSKFPAVGTTMTLTATVKVTSAEERESEGSGKRRSLGFQITHMALEPKAGAKEAMDKALKNA